MNSEKLLIKVKKHAKTIDEYLINFIRRGEEIKNLHDGMIYALGLDSKEQKLRGKRLRPSLGLLVCEALGADPEIILPFSAAVEIFHNFTLVHDDIEDGDTVRRNRPCVYVKYGLDHGINIGDFMLVESFRALLEKVKGKISPAKRLRIMDMMINAFEHTHIGQSLDMNARSSDNLSTEEYFRIVREKTGYCLAASMEAAAIVTGAGKKVRDAIQNYAGAIGPLFQIRDDVLDLTEGKGRGAIGSDIREGKRSYLIAHVNGKCTAKEKTRLYKILNAARKKTTDLHVEWVYNLFIKYGSIEAARAENEMLLNEAFFSIKDAPKKLRTLLEAFAELLLKRDK
jgi:geranylgeranyl diphosphate synthase, type I